MDFIDSGDDNDDNIDVTECFTEKDKLIILLFIDPNNTDGGKTLLALCLPIKQFTLEGC